jgi:hypothetical protein
MTATASLYRVSARSARAYSIEAYLLARIALVALAAILGVGAQLRLVGRHGGVDPPIEPVTSPKSWQPASGAATAAYQHAQRDRKAG